jgi:hypothetical protein
MFGFGKKNELEKGFKDLPEVRDLMKDLLGNAMDVYVGTTVGYLASLGGKTAEDVEKTRKDMLTVLQKYVQAEILLDRQKRGHEPSLAEIAYLRLK